MILSFMMVIELNHFKVLEAKKGQLKNRNVFELMGPFGISIFRQARMSGTAGT